MEEEEATVAAAADFLTHITGPAVSTIYMYNTTNRHFPTFCPVWKNCITNKSPNELKKETRRNKECNVVHNSSSSSNFKLLDGLYVCDGMEQWTHVGTCWCCRHITPRQVLRMRTSTSTYKPDVNENLHSDANHHHRRSEGGNNMPKWNDVIASDSPPPPPLSN
jgi:hypothetical protein